MRNKWASAFLVALWMTCSAVGQSKQPATNETTGTCSNVFNDNHGTITITCQGFSQKQNEQITALIKGIAQTESKNKDVLLQKLEEVLTAVKAVQPISPNKNVTTYKCNGWALVKSPSGTGMLNFSTDPALSVDFEAMRNLGVQQRWADLLSACKKELSDHPEWLTSNLFCADASIKLGNSDEGRRYLSNFDSQKLDAYDEEPCQSFEKFVKGDLGLAPLNQPPQ